MCRLHAADSSRADSLLLKLDQAIKERPIYMEQKELTLVELKRQLHRQIPDEELFAILGTLLDEYRSFNTDSALHMAEEDVDKRQGLCGLWKGSAERIPRHRHLDFRYVRIPVSYTHLVAHDSRGLIA